MIFMMFVKRGCCVLQSVQEYTGYTRTYLTLSKQYTNKTSTKKARRRFTGEQETPRVTIYLVYHSGFSAERNYSKIRNPAWVSFPV